jgi:hypothetical protein
VLAWLRAGTVARVLRCWHRGLGSGHGGGVACPMQRLLRLVGNGQREQRSSAGVITRAGSRRRALVLQRGRPGALLEERAPEQCEWGGPGWSFVSCATS